MKQGISLEQAVLNIDSEKVGTWTPAKANIPTFSLPVTDKPVTTATNTTKPLIIGDSVPKINNPLPLNTNSNSSSMDTTKDYDLVFNVPAPGTQTQAQIELQEAERRRRTMWIGGGVLVAMILLIIVLSLRK